LKVAVIGSTGQLGQDLMRVFGEEAVEFSHQDLDVTDGVSVASAIHSLRPDWVLNTAAFHRVDDCEVNPTLAFAVNTLGALNVGVSKAAGEQLVMQANERHLVVRSAGLYGTATSRKGWTFPELMLNKAQTEGMVHVVTDQVLSPTFTADLAQKTKELIEQDIVGLFHLTNSGECSWFEFAQGVFDLAGVGVEMKPISTEQTQRRAHRPSYSALATARLEAAGLRPLRSWKEALSDYLRVKGIV